MAPSKSQVRDLTELFISLLQDESASNGVVLERDKLTIVSRISHEGLSFVTKTLPSLGKALDYGLEHGRFIPPARWKVRKGQATPEFLRGLHNLVFDARTGSLLDQPSIAAIRSLRQICFFMYKLKLPYSAVQEEVVINNFILTDTELDLGDDDALFESASHLIENVLKDLDVSVIVPKHGPGAVATGEKAEDKWTFGRIYRQVDRLYPFDQYFMVGGDREVEDRMEWHNSLLRDIRPVAKVVLVPKDSRGPRLISEEPLEIQYVQQGIKELLYSHIESSPLTGGRVNFSDQSINRSLAYSSSRDGKYATIDLKDASDRVSLSLVEWLFKRTAILPYLIATRSTATMLPDRRIVELRKFAPMGSALCFPIEALTFWALIVAHLHRSTRRSLQSIVASVYVYGDDIIVPVEWVDAARYALTVAGLVVNDSKSYRYGKFRESCGLDAYDGVVVTPLRLRSLPPSRRTDGESLSNWCALASEFLKRGYSNLAETLYRRVETTIGPLPSGFDDCGYLSRWEPSRACALASNKRRGFRIRWNSSLQRIEVKAYAVSPKLRETRLDDWPRLLRSLVDPVVASDPSKVADRRATSVKRRWRTVY